MLTEEQLEKAAKQNADKKWDRNYEQEVQLWTGTYNGFIDGYKFSQEELNNKNIVELAVQYAQEQCEHEQVDRQKELENAFVMGAVKGYKLGFNLGIEYVNKRILDKLYDTSNEYDLGGTENWTDDDWKKALSNYAGQK